MKKVLVRIIIAIVLVSLLVYLGRRHFDRLYLILETSPLILAGIAGLFVIMRSLQGEVFRRVLRFLGAGVSFFEANMLAMLASLTNLVLPRLGLGAPAVYLKKRHNFPYANFGSLMLPTILLQVACIGVVGLLCELWLFSVGSLEWSWPLAGVLALSLVLSLLVLLIPIRIGNNHKWRIVNFFQRLFSSWEILRTNKKLLCYMFALQVLVLLAQALRLWVCFKGMGIEVSIPAIIIASFLGHLGTLVGYTPGGLGFREAAITVGCQLMGVDPSSALAAAVLDRIVMTATVLGFGGFSLWYLFKPMRKEIEQVSVND